MLNLKRIIPLRLRLLRLIFKRIPLRLLHLSDIPAAKLVNLRHFIRIFLRPLVKLIRVLVHFATTFRAHSRNGNLIIVGLDDPPIIGHYPFRGHYLIN